jgi:hypothetical protein
VLGVEALEHDAEHRIEAQLVVIDEVLPAGPLAGPASGGPMAIAKTRWPTSVATSWTTRPGVRPSLKQPAKRSTSRIARSVAPSSIAPASEVIAPPSKSATTARPSTGAKAIVFALHSVGIGEPSCCRVRLCRRRTFPRSGPRCTPHS